MTRILAPYAATCELCPRPIEPGQEIVADDDTAAVHAECLDRVADAENTPCLSCGVFQCEECADYVDHDACCCGRRRYEAEVADDAETADEGRWQQ